MRAITMEVPVDAAAPRRARERDDEGNDARAGQGCARAVRDDERARRRARRRRARGTTRGGACDIARSRARATTGGETRKGRSEARRCATLVVG